jgi:hypothetical protein
MVKAVVLRSRQLGALRNRLFKITKRSPTKRSPTLKTALQAQRKGAIAKTEEEARLLLQLAEIEGGDYDPADDFPPESQPLGFVFSRPASSVKSSVPSVLAAVLNQPSDSNQQQPRHRANLRLIEKRAATQN